MILITNTGPNEKFYFEFGEYLPFQASIASGGAGSQLYWRRGDFHRTLLEIGVDQHSGRLNSLSLLLPGSVAQGLADPGRSLERRVGVPLVDLGGWLGESSVQDDVGSLEVMVDGSRMLLNFGDIRASYLIECGDVEFGVDADGVLAWVCIGNLDPVEVAEFAQNAP